MQEGSGLLRLPVPALLCGASGPGGRGAGCWQLRVRRSADVLTARVPGRGSWSVWWGRCSCLQGGVPLFASLEARTVLPLSAEGHASLHMPAASEPQREPLQALLQWEAADRPESGRGRRERTRAGALLVGPWAGPWTGLWVISVLGVTWLHPSVASVRGASLLVAVLMPEKADLGSAPGAGARGQGLQHQTGGCALGREPRCRGSECLVRVLLRLLIQAGYELNVQDHDGWTPLHAAAHWGVKEACSILAEALCDMDVRSKLVSGLAPSGVLEHEARRPAQGPGLPSGAGTTNSWSPAPAPPSPRHAHSPGGRRPAC